MKKKDEKLLKEQLARALADYDNLRKRVETQKEFWVRYSTERILIKLLPVLDTFESAQNHLKDQGLSIAIAEFKKALNEEGIEEIEPQQGEKFDAGAHEVVESVEGKDKGNIAEKVLTGWRFKEGKVIRFAKVKVFGEKPPVDGGKKEELIPEVKKGDYI